MKRALLILLLGLVTTSAFAEMGPFGLDTGLSLGLGTMKSGGGTIPSRTMDTLAIHVFPGYKAMGFMFGPYFAYDFVGQPTDPATVKNQNLKGTGYTLGLAAQYSLLNFVFTGGLDFIGKYSQSLTTVSGTSSNYTKPFGIRLGAGFFFIPMFSLDATLTITSYSNNNLGGVDTDISNDKLTHTNYALGVSWHF